MQCAYAPPDQKKIGIKELREKKESTQSFTNVYRIVQTDDQEIRS